MNRGIIDSTLTGSCSFTACQAGRREMWGLGFQRPPSKPAGHKGKVMEKKRSIWVPWNALRYLERALTREPRSRKECLLENESVVYTVSFGDGVKMDVRQ